MDDNKLTNIIKSKYLTVPVFLYSICRDLKISGDEFILLMYLNDLGEKSIFDPNIIEQDLHINLPVIMEFIDDLTSKGLVELKTIPDNQKVLQEYIFLTPFYNKVKLKIIDNDKDKEVNSSIYEVIEKEFGRPLSPMEYEIIKAWLNDYSSEELVLEALKEAIYNGVYNLRYMDVILNEWHKKGYKKVTDIIRKKDEKKNEPKEVFDYDWLNDEDG